MGYILLETSTKTSVEKISETKPLNPSDYDSVLDHCLAAQYFGMKFIYLENGSGADDMVDSKLINYLSSNLDISIIVGGGIKSSPQIDKIKSSGAKFVVVSTALEQNPNSAFISELLR